MKVDGVVIFVGGDGGYLNTILSDQTCLNFLNYEVVGATI